MSGDGEVPAHPERAQRVEGPGESTAVHPERSRGARFALNVLRVGAVVAIFAALVATGRLKPELVVSSLGKPVFLGVLGLQLVVLAMNMGRWVFLLRAQLPELKRRRAWIVALRAHFTTLVLPGLGGTDAVRLANLRDVPIERVGGTLVTDRIMAASGAGLVLAASVAWAWFSNWREPLMPVLPMAALTAVAIGLAIPSLWVVRRVFGASKHRLMVTLRRAADVAMGGLTGARTAIPGIALAATSILLNCASGALALSALGATSVASALMVTPLVQIAGSLPVTPQGLGVAESASEWLYSSVGIAGGAEALLLVRVAWVIGTALAGIAWLLSSDSVHPERRP